MNEQTIHLLLVEDEEAHADLVRRAFEPHAAKYSLVVANTLEQARQYLAESIPDLLITDLALPDGRGTELLSGDKEDLPFPVIVMTGHGDEPSAVEAMKAGALDYVVKSDETFAAMPRVAERALREWGHMVERKRAEQALAVSANKYRLMVENASIGIIAVDRKGRITEVNTRLLEIMGSLSAEATKPINVLTFPPLVNAGVSEVIRRCVEEEKTITADMPYTSKWGKHAHLKIMLTPTRDSEGMVSGCQAIVEDITYQKRAEKELAEKERYFRSLLYNIHEDIVVIDRDYRITDLNNTAMVTSGHKREDVIGRPCFRLFHGYDEPCDKHGEECRLTEVFETGKPASCHHVHRTHDGGEVHVDVLLSPLLDESGRVTHVIEAVRDVSDLMKTEEALRESEGRYTDLFAGTSDGVAVYQAVDDGMDFIFVDFNAAGEKIDNMSKDQLLGKSVLKVFPGVKEFGLLDVLQRVWRTGEPERHPVTRYKDERIEGWRDNQVYKLPSGEVVAVYSDETERMRNLEALTARTHELGERVKELNCLYEISQLVRKPGISLEGIVQGVVDLIPPAWQYPEITCARIILEDQEVKTDNFGEAASKLTRDISASGERIGSIDVGYLTERPEAEEGPFLKEERSLINAIAERLGRIVQRFRTEDKIRTSQLLLESVLQNLPIQVFVKDAEELKFVLVNKALETITGHRIEELLGKTDHDLFPKEQADFFVSTDGEALATGTVVDIPEESIETKSGDTRLLHTRKVPVFDEDGKPQFLIGISEDITDHKNIERQLRQAQKMESIGTLAGGIAHDFNNLLTIILGYSELSLLGKEEGDPGYQDLQTILQTTKRGADLVRQILTFSREVETQPRPISLNHEVEQAQKLLYKTISKMIEIQLFMAEDLKTINADPVQVEQVVMNLAVNSQHAMPDGGRLVFETKNVILDEEYCKTHLEAQPGEYVMLMVSDTGHGIEKEALEHIFEPFYSTKKPGEGTGLGLAMVHGIVKQNRGFINCYSEPGVGTTFKIYLPTLDLGTKSDVETSGVTPAFGTETILLVDDEELIRDLGQRHLSRAGYTVLTALNGQEALEIYERQRADISLVLLDLIMPEMGGRECLEELLRIDPQVKVLIASGFSVNGPTRDAIEGGARGFVSKPFDMKRLLQTVRKVLDES